MRAPPRACNERTSKVERYDFVKTRFHVNFEVVVLHELEDTRQLRQDSFLCLSYTQRYLFTIVIVYEWSLSTCVKVASMHLCCISILMSNETTPMPRGLTITTFLRFNSVPAEPHGLLFLSFVPSIVRSPARNPYSSP